MKSGASRIAKAKARTRRAASPRACWYRVIKAKADGEYTVDIEGDIGTDTDSDGKVIGVSADTLIKKLKALSDLKALTIPINSAGGNVFDGIAIYLYLRELSKSGVKVTVRIGALCASIASVIAMAGDTIEIHPQSMMMIHDPWIEMSGNSAELRKQADMLDKLRSTMMSAYKTKNTGISDADLEAQLAAETWMTGDEAVAAGFADVLVDVALSPKALALRNGMIQAKAEDEGKGDEEDEDDDANAEGDDDDEANASSGVAAALGAIAEGIQEVLNKLSASDDDEDDGEGDDEDEANAGDEEDEDKAKAKAKARAAARAAGKPVNTSSKQYKALKKIATANGQVGDFITYVAAGASLKTLQAKFLETEPSNQKRIQSSAGGRQPKATQLDPSAYYATLNGKKKES